MAFFKPITFLFLLLPAANLFAQKDSAAVKKQKINIFSLDTSRPYNPKIAILRSAIIPGWGQATNKKYWKMPIVYGALGVTAYIFCYDLHQFKEINKAFKNASDGNISNDNEIPEKYYGFRTRPDVLKNFRNTVRQNIDYSALIFIIFWGLNVVDAAVDAHLKTFDVSDKLSLQIKPGYNSMANTNGINLTLNIGKFRPKQLSSY